MKIFCLFLQFCIFLMFLPLSEQSLTENFEGILPSILHRIKGKVSPTSSSSSTPEKSSTSPEEMKIKEFIGTFVNPLAEKLKCEELMKINEETEIVMINGEMAENEHKIAICKQFLKIKKIEGKEFVNEFRELIKLDYHNFNFYKNGKSWAGKQQENWKRIQELKRESQIKNIIKTSLPHLINRLDERQSLMTPIEFKMLEKKFPLGEKELNKQALAHLASNISLALKILKNQLMIGVDRILIIFIVELHIYAVEVEEIWQSGILKKWDWKMFPDFYE